MPYTLTRLTSNTICVDSLLIDDPVEVQTLTHAMLQAHADGFIEITPPPGSAEIGPPGPPGTPGQGFTIAKVYSSVAALTADVAPTGINSGEFAIIDTGDVENPENSRIYVWNGSTYSYVNDLSGEMGIQGFQGLPGTAGAQGEAGDPKVLATQAEAEAGTDNSAYMSPLRNMQALKAQLIAGGNITLTPQAGGVEITASASGSTTFIYAPSKTQAGNVFNNWGDLTTHIAAMPDGEIPTVIFTESCTLPVGTYNMKLGKWASSTMSTGAITVTLPDGMLIQNLCYIQDGLQVNVEPTTADGVFVNTLFGGFNILVIGLGAKLVNLGTKAAIVTDGFLVVAQFFATIAVTPYSTAPWVKCLDGHTVQAMILGNLVFSQFEEDWVVGGGTTGNLLYFHGDSFAVPPLTQWTGNPPTYINSAKAEMVQYFDSFEPSVTTGATQVQQAIDWLKVNSLRDAPSDTKLYGRKDGAWAEVTGADGTAGSIWRSGSGVPSNALGADSDFYLDTATGDVYKKVSGAYVLEVNIKGPAGQDGLDGQDGTNGADGTVIPLTNTFYVDGSIGDDTIAAGNGAATPFKTIQACLDYIGQPITMADSLRHIKVYIADSMTAGVGNGGGGDQSWNGVYHEDLVIPARIITFYGAGIKIGKNYNTSDNADPRGNIKVELSSSRRFGASSSDLRHCVTFIGMMNPRDSHNRLRNGMHVGGNFRVAVLRRLLSSIQGNGTNTITVEVAAGQSYYPITIPSTYPTEPLIYIGVTGTTNYNGGYTITSKIDDTHFVATRLSGTNANTGIETSGAFYESDVTGGSGAVTHDMAFVNTYIQGQYTVDDGTLNGGTAVAPSAGQEVLYSVNSRWFTGIQGRTIQIQRWENTTWAAGNAITAGSFIIGVKYAITSLGTTDFTLIGAAANVVGTVFIATGVGTGTGTATPRNLVNNLDGMNNVSLSGVLEVNTSIVYSTDDLGWVNCRFNSAVPISVPAGQTVRMDAMTYDSFLGSGSTWATNTPTVVNLDNSTLVRGLTDKGQIFVATGPNAYAVLAAPTANNQVLTSDNTTPTGLKWV